MRILSATDYGSRKVVRVVVNDTDSEWVHPDGRNAPFGDTGDTEEAKELGKSLCLDCRFNWDVREYQFEGDALLKRDPDFLPPLIPDPRFKPPEDDPDAESPLIPNLDPDIVPFIPKTDQELKNEALATTLASMPVAVRDMGT